MKRPPVEDLAVLVAAGCTDTEIAARYGVAVSTVGRWRRRGGIRSPEHRGRPRNTPAERRLVTVTLTAAEYSDLLDLAREAGASPAEYLRGMIVTRAAAVLR